MYFVAYDLYDNIVAYFDDLDELSSFVRRRKKQLKYKFKTQNVVIIESKPILKIYKFS